MARIPFVDTFDSLRISAGYWDGGSYNTSAFSTPDNTLHATCSAGSTLYHGLVSEGGNDLTGNQITLQIVNAGNQSLTSFEFYPIQLYKNGDPSNKYWFYISQGSIAAYSTVANTQTWRWGTTYNASVHTYLRIRESGGTIYWDYSADGTTWTNAYSMANAFVITDMQLEITVGTWASEASASTAIIDNLNYLPGDTPVTPPPTPTPVTITADRVPFGDSFDSLVITGRYDDSYNVSTITANGNLQLKTNSGESVYHGLATGTPFDLTGKETTIQVIDAGNQSLQSFELYPMQLYPAGNTSNNLVWFISGGSLAAYVTIGGNRFRRWSTSFDINTHKYLRIRESGGTAYYGYSTDGTTWIEVYNTPISWTITSMTLEMTVGTWQSEAASSTAILDNLNILPGDVKVIINGFFNFF